MSLKPLPAEKLIYVLRKVGFEIKRQKGSHVF
ncbi:MAG: type II toxin-antitoxin system HicA family toxin [Candidatus Freyarchaeota archaeon]